MTTAITQNSAYHTYYNRTNRTRAARKRLVQKQKCMLLFTAAVLLVLCLVFFGSSLLASAKNNTAASHTAHKYYTSVQLESGDSLWSIAEERASLGYRSYQEYIDEVIQLNHLEDDSIHAGEYLMVPYFSYD